MRRSHHFGCKIEGAKKPKVRIKGGKGNCLLFQKSGDHSVPNSEGQGDNRKECARKGELGEITGIFFL